MSDNYNELIFDSDIEENTDDLQISEDKRNIITQQSDPQIDSLHKKHKKKKLDIQPNFQRKFVWDKTKASLLIESALLGSVDIYNEM